MRYHKEDVLVTRAAVIRGLTITLAVLQLSFSPARHAQEVTLSNGNTVATGTGMAVCDVELMQDRAYFEVRYATIHVMRR